MEKIISQLNEKKIFFESLIQKTKVALKKSPDEGHLRVGRSKGKPQYFQMTQKGDTNGRYLCQKRPELKALTMRLAQRDYNLKRNYSAPKIPGIMQDFQQRQVLQLQRRLFHVFLLSRYKNGF